MKKQLSLWMVATMFLLSCGSPDKTGEKTEESAAGTKVHEEISFELESIPDEFNVNYVDESGKTVTQKSIRRVWDCPVIL